MGLISKLHLLATVSLFSLSLGCAAGYVQTADLERENQGPTACHSRCQEMGMEMGALVLVSNAMPACVCQPLADGRTASMEGGAGATGGHVAIAIAAAAAQAQQQRQQQMAAAAAAR